MGLDVGLLHLVGYRYIVSFAGLIDTKYHGSVP